MMKTVKYLLNEELKVSAISYLVYEMGIRIIKAKFLVETLQKERGWENVNQGANCCGRQR